MNPLSRRPGLCLEIHAGGAGTSQCSPRSEQGLCVPAVGTGSLCSEGHYRQGVAGPHTKVVCRE